jgi:hypothetical protein
VGLSAFDGAAILVDHAPVEKSFRSQTVGLNNRRLPGGQARRDLSRVNFSGRCGAGLSRQIPLRRCGSQILPRTERLAPADRPVFACGYQPVNCYRRRGSWTAVLRAYNFCAKKRTAWTRSS